MLSTLYSCQILVKSEFSRQIFKKFMNIKFHEFILKGFQYEPSCSMRKGRQTDRRTNTMKPIVSFRNFAKAPKTNVENFFVTILRALNN